MFSRLPLRVFGIALLGCGAGSGCRVAGTPPKGFEFRINVMSEPNEPVAAATLVHEGVQLGKTDAAGTFALSTPGIEGETFLVDVHCPPNLHSPLKPLAIVLRRLSESQHEPQYDVTCAPRTRTLVVAIRADNGADIPVRHLGRELARTDSSGSTLIALDVAPDEPIDLTLDTSKSPWLKPKDPTQRFQINESDGLFTFNQRFFGESVKLVKGRKRSGPIRIDSR